LIAVITDRHLRSPAGVPSPSYGDLPAHEARQQQVSAGTEPLGSVGALGRYYDVDAMVAPLDNLKRVTVHVTWNQVRACSVQAVTYVRR
jgi:hypothetical protein